MDTLDLASTLLSLPAGSLEKLQASLAAAHCSASPSPIAPLSPVPPTIASSLAAFAPSTSPCLLSSSAPMSPLAPSTTISMISSASSTSPSNSMEGGSGTPPKLDTAGMERPSLSYKDLIIEAIESAPEKRLKLNEIYQVIRMLHPYYRMRPDQWGWQNSIRHNLSLHDCFVKLPLKQTNASGVVGHYWTVVPELSDKQTLRRRNRNATSRSKPRPAAAATSRSDDSPSGSPHSSSSASPSNDFSLPKPIASYGSILGLAPLEPALPAPPPVLPSSFAAELINHQLQQLITQMLYSQVQGLLAQHQNSALAEIAAAAASTGNPALLEPLLALSKLAGSSPVTPPQTASPATATTQFLL